MQIEIYIICKSNLIFNVKTILNNFYFILILIYNLAVYNLLVFPPFAIEVNIFGMLRYNIFDLIHGQRK